MDLATVQAVKVQDYSCGFSPFLREAINLGLPSPPQPHS